MTTPRVVQGRFGVAGAEMPDALATILLVKAGRSEEQAQIAFAAAAGL
jgi:hypothetical protein